MNKLVNRSETVGSIGVQQKQIFNNDRGKRLELMPNCTEKHYAVLNR
jgi:hypothetical protein